RRAEIIIANVDHPSALADRQAAQGDDVVGIELALGQTSASLGIRHGHRERGHAEENRVAGEAVGTHEARSPLLPFFVETPRPWLAAVPRATQWPAAGRVPPTPDPASWPRQGNWNPPNNSLIRGAIPPGNARLDAFSCAHYRSAGLRSRRWSRQ